MLNKRVTTLPGLDNDRLLTNAQHLESALDEWHESGLDTSSDVLALQAFANRWRRNAMLIALRALRRVEDLRLAETHASPDGIEALGVGDHDDIDAADTTRIEKRSEKKRLSTPEYYEQAIADWAASGLDTSTNPTDFVTFGAKWRTTATLIALRADRRVDQLRTIEAHGRELEARQLLAAEAQRQREVARVADAERAFKAAQHAATDAGDNNASNALGHYERQLGDWGARGLDKVQKADELVNFATKWRQDPTLVALGAERRVDHLRALEFDARGGRVRSGTAADRRPVATIEDASHQEGMAAASAQAAAASFAYGAIDLYEPAPAARPLMERTYSVTENFNFALDDWQQSGLDESNSIAAFQAFVARWKTDATLIALRAERRIETLRKQQDEQVATRVDAAARAAAGQDHLDYIARHPIDLTAVEQASPMPAAPQLTSAQHIAAAAQEWDVAALEFSGDRSALSAFSDRWRRDAEIISLRADRRLEELRAEKLRLDPDWQETLRANTVVAYEAFQAKHPHSQYQKELAKRMLLIDDEHAWRKTAALGTTDAYRAYLQAWPSGSYNREARVGMMGGAAAPTVPPALSVPLPTVAVVSFAEAVAPPTPPVSLAPVATVPQVIGVQSVVGPTATEASPPLVADPSLPTKSSRRMLLTWLAVLALAAAGALLTFFFLPHRLNVAGAPQSQQVTDVARAEVVPEVLGPPGHRVAAPSEVRASRERATAQFSPPVEEPVPNATATSAAGLAVTPARHALDAVASTPATIAPATIAPLNDWNVATAAHAGWSVRLAPLNDWNVATAAHVGWPVRLAPLNDWNVATAAHAGWSVRLAPLNGWNSATTPHTDWRVRLATLNSANGPTGPHLGWTERLAASNASNGGVHPQVDWPGYLAKANGWNGATLPHEAWSVRLAPRDGWNQVVVGPHRDWRPYLAAANEWNTITAPHAIWPSRLRASHTWNGPARPHLHWRLAGSLEALRVDADVSMAIERGPLVERDIVQRQDASAETQMISTASIPRVAETVQTSAKLRDVAAERTPAPTARERAQAKLRVRRAAAVADEDVAPPTPKRAARSVPEPEPELETKSRPVREPPPRVAALKVEVPRKAAPPKEVTKEAAKATPVKPVALKPTPVDKPVAPNAWLKDIFASRN
jgi:hypothetical protein